MKRFLAYSLSVAATVALIMGLAGTPAHADQQSPTSTVVQDCFQNGQYVAPNPDGSCPSSHTDPTTTSTTRPVAHPDHIDCSYGYHPEPQGADWTQQHCAPDSTTSTTCPSTQYQPSRPGTTGCGGKLAGGASCNYPCAQPTHIDCSYGYHAEPVGAPWQQQHCAKDVSQPPASTPKAATAQPTATTVTTVTGVVTPIELSSPAPAVPAQPVSIKAEPAASSGRAGWIAIGIGGLLGAGGLGIFLRRRLF